MSSLSIYCFVTFLLKIKFGEIRSSSGEKLQYFIIWMCYNFFGHASVDGHFFFFFFFSLHL